MAAPAMICRASDGFFHPSSEEELVALVKKAYHEGRQLRVRGAAHSVAEAIYTDPDRWRPFEDRVNQQTPPPTDDINVKLDRYCGCWIRSEKDKLVEAQAGVHLGADPGDPTSPASLTDSLLYRLDKTSGWTLAATGGITHQTIAGFTATGSAGGSLQHSLTDNLWAFRIIDGTGNVHVVTRDKDPAFYAMAPNLGLLGVVSTITFRCEDLFAVSGSESVTTEAGAPFSLDGHEADGRPSLERFLRETPYARVEWWPQLRVDRVVTWRAERRAWPPAQVVVPYQRFGRYPEFAQAFIDVFSTVEGNTANLKRARQRLARNLPRILHARALRPEAPEPGTFDALLMRLLGATSTAAAQLAVQGLELMPKLLRKWLPTGFSRLVNLFVPLDRDGPQCFLDVGWRTLPMDNLVDDLLVAVAFTELAIPLPRAAEAVQVLRKHFAGGSSCTGTSAWELYAGKSSKFWLSPFYTDGEDEWKDGALRIDPYWFVANEERPETFFGPLWDIFRKSGIPFRLHWGKLQPPPEPTWPKYFQAQYSRWDEFLALRAKRDPNNIFLTNYWRDRLGLWQEPAAAPPSAPSTA